jgi:hypothetical protein
VTVTSVTSGRNPLAARKHLKRLSVTPRYPVTPVARDFLRGGGSSSLRGYGGYESYASEIATFSALPPEVTNAKRGERLSPLPVVELRADPRVGNRKKPRSSTSNLTHYFTVSRSLLSAIHARWIDVNLLSVLRLERQS